MRSEGLVRLSTTQPKPSQDIIVLAGKDRADLWITPLDIVRALTLSLESNTLLYGGWKSTSIGYLFATTCHRQHQSLGQQHGYRDDGPKMGFFLRG